MFVQHYQSTPSSDVSGTSLDLLFHRGYRKPTRTTRTSIATKTPNRIFHQLTPSVPCSNSTTPILVLRRKATGSTGFEFPTSNGSKPGWNESPSSKPALRISMRNSGTLMTNAPFSHTLLPDVPINHAGDGLSGAMIEIKCELSRTLSSNCEIPLTGASSMMS